MATDDFNNKIRDKSIIIIFFKLKKKSSRKITVPEHKEHEQGNQGWGCEDIQGMGVSSCGMVHNIKWAQ